ncbi:MAG: translation elongation factor Ts [Eubacteriales bacterium]
MITAQAVKELREATGAGMMDCKKALVETDGNIEKAMDYLREKGLAAAAKKAGRIAAEGVVNSFISDDKKTGVLLEVNCETDFVAKTPEFQGFVAKIAGIASEGTPADVDALLAMSKDGKTVKDMITEQISTIGENISLRRFDLVKSEGAVDAYIHMGGKIGVIVEFGCPAGAADNADFTAFMHDIAMQIAASKPLYVNQTEVPSDEVEHEKEVLKAQALNEGKPENIVEKMVMGRINKFYSQVCLVDQVFVKDDSKKVKDIVKAQSAAVGGDVSIVKFTRYEMGEGLQKREDDFVSEVMNQAGK